MSVLGRPPLHQLRLAYFIVHLNCFRHVVAVEAKFAHQPRQRHKLSEFGDGVE